MKQRVFSESTLNTLRQNKMDTSAISTLLEDGDVLFSESITKMDTCNKYVIEGEILERILKITVENCEKTATVIDAKINNQ